MFVLVWRILQSPNLLVYEQPPVYSALQILGRIWSLAIFRQIAYLVKTNTITNLAQIRYHIKTNTISSKNKYNIEIFPDLLCAEDLYTSRQFVASAFGKPLVVRINGNL